MPLHEQDAELTDPEAGHDELHRLLRLNEASTVTIDRPAIWGLLTGSTRDRLNPFGGNHVAERENALTSQRDRRQDVVTGSVDGGHFWRGSLWCFYQPGGSIFRN